MAANGGHKSFVLNAPGTTRTCDLLVRSSLDGRIKKSHLTTSTNIFNELQPLVSAAIYANLGLFPVIVVTRLSQAKMANRRCN
jgi:hypothetical protein